MIYIFLVLNKKLTKFIFFSENKTNILSHFTSQEMFLIQERLDICSWKQVKNTKQEPHYLHRILNIIFQ